MPLVNEVLESHERTFGLGKRRFDGFPERGKLMTPGVIVLMELVFIEQMRIARFNSQVVFERLLNH